MIISEPSRARVLKVVDRTVLVAIAIASIGNVIQRPTGSARWVVIFGVMVALTGLLALLGRAGGAGRRRQIYPVVVLAVAVGSLWANGPLGGVGVMFGVAILLAGALLSRRGLVAIVVVAIAAIVLRMAIAVGWWSGSSEAQRLEFSEFSPWARVAIGTALLLWIATQILGELLVSLETSYTQAVDALRIERETRTQLGSSRQQLEEVEQVELVGRLAGGVAHDINNALTAIMAASDVLGDEVVTGDQRRWLTELEAASHHAAELVRDLLWIGRKLPPTTEAADLEDTVRACRARLDRMARAITIDVQLERSFRVAMAPERLEQLLFWLVLRAHRSGVGQLALVARREGAMVEIDLRGMEAGAPSASLDVRPKAVRAQLSTSAANDVLAQAGGSLTIVHDGALLHVSIRIPAAIEAPRPAPPRGDREVTALVVDDEPGVLARLTKLVERRGYRVLAASSLAEAWPLLDANPDLLVTDLQLGDGRGEALAIASFERHPERPIVVCSGFGADDALRERLRGAHVTFLAKPFTRADLEHAIPSTSGEAT